MARRGAIAIAAWAVLALTGACRSGEKGAAAPTGQAQEPAAAPAPRPGGPTTSSTPAPASDPRTITVTAKGQPWVQIIARGETLTVVTEGVSLVGQPRDGGKRKYAPAGGGPVLVEVKPQPSTASEAGESAIRFKLRSPDGKLLWKVKAGTTKIKVAGDQDDRREDGKSDEQEGKEAFVVSAKHPADVAVLAPGGLTLGRIRTSSGTKDVTGEDAAGAELFRTSTDLPPATFGVLLLQGMPLRERAVILAELAARMTAR